MVSSFVADLQSLGFESQARMFSPCVGGLIPGTPVSSPVHALQADGHLVVRSVGMCVPSSVRRAGTLSRVFTAPSVPSSPD